jgi:hypothetical protein
MSKKECTKLVVHYYSEVDADNHFTNKYEWFYPNGDLIFREVRKIQRGEDGQRKDTFDMEEKLSMIQNCCLIIDRNNFEIQEIHH